MATLWLHCGQLIVRTSIVDLSNGFQKKRAAMMDDLRLARNYKLINKRFLFENRSVANVCCGYYPLDSHNKPVGVRFYFSPKKLCLCFFGGCVYYAIVYFCRFVWGSHTAINQLLKFRSADSQVGSPNTVR